MSIIPRASLLVFNSSVLLIYLFLSQPILAANAGEALHIEEDPAILIEIPTLPRMPIEIYEETAREIISEYEAHRAALHVVGISTPANRSDQVPLPFFNLSSHRAEPESVFAPHSINVDGTNIGAMLNQANSAIHASPNLELTPDQQFLREAIKQTKESFLKIISPERLKEIEAAPVANIFEELYELIKAGGNAPYSLCLEEAGTVCKNNGGNPDDTYINYRMLLLMNAAHYMYKKELAKIEKMIPDLDGAAVTKPDAPLNNLCDEIFNELDYIVKKGMILFKTILETSGSIEKLMIPARYYGFNASYDTLSMFLAGDESRLPEFFNVLYPLIMKNFELASRTFLVKRSIAAYLYGGATREGLKKVVACLDNFIKSLPMYSKPIWKNPRGLKKEMPFEKDVKDLKYALQQFRDMLMVLYKFYKFDIGDLNFSANDLGFLTSDVVPYKAKIQHLESLKKKQLKAEGTAYAKEAVGNVETLTVAKLGATQDKSNQPKPHKRHKGKEVIKCHAPLQVEEDTFAEGLSNAAAPSLAAISPAVMIGSGSRSVDFALSAPAASREQLPQAGDEEFIDAFASVLREIETVRAEFDQKIEQLKQKKLWQKNQRGAAAATPTPTPQAEASVPIANVASATLVTPSLNLRLKEQLAKLFYPNNANDSITRNEVESLLARLGGELVGEGNGSKFKVVFHGHSMGIIKIGHEKDNRGLLDAVNVKFLVEHLKVAAYRGYISAEILPPGWDIQEDLGYKLIGGYRGNNKKASASQASA